MNTIPWMNNPQYPVFAQNKWINIFLKEDEINFLIKFDNYLTGSEGFTNLIKTIKNDKKMLAFIYISNELYKEGMKTIKLGFKECLALEQIELNIDFSKEYEQSYRTIMIEFSEEYQNYLRKKYVGAHVPRISIIHLEKFNNLKASIICFPLGKDYQVLTNFITNECGNIENILNEFLNENAQKDIDFVMCRYLLRVIFNICYLMTILGHHKYGYENIKRQRQLERNDKKNRTTTAKRELYYIGLKQEIKLWEERRNEKGKELEGERHSPHPHWRKGHFRRQWIGDKENRKTKIIFIKPVFVCSETYKGDMSDTGVTYK